MNKVEPLHHRLDDKVIVITGAFTFIGYATAMELAKLGAQLTLACRDLKRAQAAADKIKTESDNQKVYIEELDLGDFDSVRNFAKRFIQKSTRLDILINNAGVLANDYSKSKNGIELHFAVNHLVGKIDFNDINLEKKSYNAFSAYGRSKLANVLFTIELAKRLKDTGVSTVSLHPGTVHTEIRRDYKGCFACIADIMFACCGVSAKEGAQTTLYCALSDDITKHSGGYYDDCKLEKFAKSVKEEDVALLWDLSAKMVKLDQQ